MGAVEDRISTFVVAVDGTAGSGKSSTSRAVAQTLGLRYLDTGAMYRAATYQALRQQVPPDDVDAVTACVERSRIESGTDPAAPTITLDGEDVSRPIRTDRVTESVSKVSAIPRVRAQLVELQRKTIGAGGIVVEGRDIGTVVAPDAELKVYLTADTDQRAQRRAAEMSEGQNRDVGAVEAALLRRDAYDSTRAKAPLSAAPDAVAVDTTHFTLDEVVEQIVNLIRRRAAEGAHG